MYLSELGMWAGYALLADRSRPGDRRRAPCHSDRPLRYYRQNFSHRTAPATRRDERRGRRASPRRAQIRRRDGQQVQDRRPGCDGRERRGRPARCTSRARRRSSGSRTSAGSTTKATSSFRSPASSSAQETGRSSSTRGLARSTCSGSRVDRWFRSWRPPASSRRTSTPSSSRTCTSTTPATSLYRTARHTRPRSRRRRTCGRPTKTSSGEAPSGPFTSPAPPT